MPKQVIRHRPGCALSEEVRSVLDKFFEEKDIQKLEILGGTVEMKLSTRVRGVKKKPNQIIDAEYLRYLENLAERKDGLGLELNSLNAKQLREVCKLLNLPVSSQLTNRRLISSIENKLLSGQRWRYIVEHRSHRANPEI